MCIINQVKELAENKIIRSNSCGIKVINLTVHRILYPGTQPLSHHIFLRDKEDGLEFLPLHELDSGYRDLRICKLGRARVEVGGCIRTM